MQRLTWITLVSAALLFGCESEADKKTAGSAAPGASSGASAKKKEHPPPTGGTARTIDVNPDDAKAGEDTCIEYQKALEACIAKGGPGTAGYKEELRKEKEALQGAQDAYKAQMAEGCATGIATLKQDPDCQ